MHVVTRNNKRSFFIANNYLKQMKSKITNVFSNKLMTNTAE